MGRPFKFVGQGKWIYSSGDLEAISIISFDLWTFGEAYMLLDFQYLLLMYLISFSWRFFECFLVCSGTLMTGSSYGQKNWLLMNS